MVLISSQKTKQVTYSTYDYEYYWRRNNVNKKTLISINLIKLTFHKLSGLVYKNKAILTKAKNLRLNLVSPKITKNVLLLVSRATISLMQILNKEPRVNAN